MNRKQPRHFAKSRTITDEVKSRVREYARRIEVAMLRGNFADARSTLKLAEDFVANPNADLTVEDSVYALVGPRVANALWGANIQTIGDLLKVSETSFVTLPNMGVDNWRSTKRKLKEAGF